MSGTDDEEILWHTGLFARLDTSFPKKCANCGRVFETAEQYFTETEDIKGKDRGLKSCELDGAETVVEAFRNCPCGSTLMETFEDHRDEVQAGTVKDASSANGGNGTNGGDGAPAAGPWADAWHNGLYPNGREAFPKECANCGRVYETAEDFFRRTTSTRDDHNGLRECEDDDSVVIVEAFRNCACGSTLMDSFSNRRDTSPDGLARRERFDQMLAYLVEQGFDAETARRELLKVARGGESTLLANIKPPESGDMQ